MTATPATPGDPVRWARRFAADLDARCGGALRAAYLHGSAVLGGWVAQRSDVDILVVVADDIAARAVEASGEVFLAPGADCPGVGLEASMVTASSAERPRAPWPFVLHIGDGRLYRGSERPGDADLIMHYAVCRAAGMALLGPPPADVIGPVGRDAILGCLADDLAWGLANASENYSVLNACRALVFCREDSIVSKVAGGEAALLRGFGPPDLVQDALRMQRGEAESRPPRHQAAMFVQEVIGHLRAAGTDDSGILG
jgi:hypothetical protein